MYSASFSFSPETTSTAGLGGDAIRCKARPCLLLDTGASVIVAADPCLPLDTGASVIVAAEVAAAALRTVDRNCNAVRNCLVELFRRIQAGAVWRLVPANAKSAASSPLDGVRGTSAANVANILD